MWLVYIGHCHVGQASGKAQNLQIVTGSLGSTRYIHIKGICTVLWIVTPFSSIMNSSLLVYMVEERLMNSEPNMNSEPYENWHLWIAKLPWIAFMK